jgi:hypothetical protein
VPETPEQFYDVLPPIPLEIWQEDVEELRRALNA